VLKNADAFVQAYTGALLRMIESSIIPNSYSCTKGVVTLQIALCKIGCCEKFKNELELLVFVSGRVHQKYRVCIM
jgi:hypothetical protein